MRQSTISLESIALVDCEASSLSEASFPIEVGWCLADTGTTGSALIVPETEWIDWDPASEAIHGIARGELFRSGLPARAAAELFVAATEGRILYADGSRDGAWLGRLFATAGLVAPKVSSFDELLDALVRPDAEPGGDSLARDLARAERQGSIIDQAYVGAQRIAPKRHRAGPDALHLRAVLIEALTLFTDWPSRQQL